MKSKKYVFELTVRESENLEKICSTITACDYDFEELKERKVDHDILLCKDILIDNLPKTNLKRIFAEHKKVMRQDPPYPDFTGSWDNKTYNQAVSEQKKEYSDCSTDEYGFKLNFEEDSKTYAFYHKPTKLWVYFLPNYEHRQVISLGLKNDATTFDEEMIYEFTHFLKNCSFNGAKNYGRDNFLEFELRTV
jgi:hypothetical protein